MGSSCTKTNKIDNTKTNNTDNTKKNNADNTKSNILLEWKSEYPLYKYHWWPMKESISPYFNNLYCKSGGLDKYDQLFGTKSVEYQKEFYFRSRDSNKSDSDWAGFCDKATILSCLYKYPPNCVNVSYDNKVIEFKPKDIEMLMIIACDNSIKNNISIFLGKRNNYKDNHSAKSEPYPSDLLQMLKIMCSSPEPFAMDIDNGSAVWNYPYDSVEVSVHLLHPEYNTYDKHINYLKFILSSSSYPDKNLELWGYMKTDIVKLSNIGTIGQQEEGWITDNHPDFLWRKFPKYNCWSGKCTTNPEISAEIVYKIYQASLRNKELHLDKIL